MPERDHRPATEPYAFRYHSSGGFVSGFSQPAERLTHRLAPSLSHSGSALAHPTPALVVDTQGGLNFWPQTGVSSLQISQQAIQVAQTSYALQP